MNQTRSVLCLKLPEPQTVAQQHKNRFRCHGPAGSVEHELQAKSHRPLLGGNGDSQYKNQTLSVPCLKPPEQETVISKRQEDDSKRQEDRQECA